MRKAWLQAGLGLLLGLFFWACDDGSETSEPLPPDLEPFLDVGGTDAGEVEVDAEARDTCLDDEACPDTHYCIKEDEADLEGRCLAGCRLAPDNCAEGTLCSAEHTCERDPRCTEDVECEPREYCGPAGACVAGCRVLEVDLCPFTEDDREQICDARTHTCTPLVVCCGNNDTCTLRLQRDCDDVLEGADRCVNPNPCEGRCAEDTDCADEDYCDADAGRCARGCRIVPGRCREDRCDPETRRVVACPCGADDDCDDAFFCDTRVGECARGCRTLPDNCPDDTLCTEARQCGEGCVDDAQCANRNGDGWYCRSGVCLAPCDGDGDCAAGMVCADRRCVAGCRDDVREQNDESASAAPLDFARRNTFESGPLNACPEDADWYLFQTPGPGWTVRVHVEFAHAEGDIDARLHAPDGSVEGGQSADDDEDIEVRDGPTGDWRLEIYGRGVETNTYTFTIDLLPPGGCVPDDLDPNDDDLAAATALSAPGLSGTAAVRGRAACADDVDWYRFDLGDRDGVRVRLTLLGNGVDGDEEVDFGLYGPGAPATDDLPVFVPNAQGGGGDLPRWVEFEIERANVQVTEGTWYLRVAPLAPGQRGAYELDVTFDRFQALCGTDSEEPNDVGDEATDLMQRPAFVRTAFAGGIELRPVVDLEVIDRWLCGGDEDWYRVELAAGDVLSATVERPADGLAGDVVVEIVGPDGQVAASARNAQPVNTAVLDEATAGTWRVRVAGVVAETQTLYTLRLNRGAGPVACEVDVVEDNDTRATASPVDAGLLPGLTLCGDEGDEDWFAITVDAVSDLTVRLRFEHAQADLDVDVFRGDEVGAQNANDAAGHSLTDDEMVRLNDRLPGTYYARVTARNGGAARYLLEVQVNPRVFICEEPAVANDTRETAVDLGNGPAVQASGVDWLCDRVPATSDWYTLRVPAGDTRAFAASFLFGDDGDLVIEAYDFQGNQVASTADIQRQNSKQCLIVDAHIGDRQLWFRLRPVTINRIIEDDERLDYRLEVVSGDDCEAIAPVAPGVTWPHVPAPF